MIFALQLAINCEIIAVLNATPVYYKLDFWDFLYIRSGHHSCYPNGYLVHWGRDLVMLLWGILVIRLGREQFMIKPEKPVEKAEVVVCPGCQRKTFDDAYCRFCGFNLVTYQPSLEGRLAIPPWKMSVLAYSGLSLALLLLNLVLIKLGLV